MKLIHSHAAQIPLFLLLSIILLLGSCKKEVDIIDDNDAPYYDGIPTTLIQNYVNRIYIDLIGREPLNTEMDADVQFLKDDSLSFESRDSLIYKLQFSTDFIEGDSSYKRAYYHRLYELAKVRLMEGASNGVINQKIGIARNAAFVDSLLNDTVGYQQAMAIVYRYRAIIDSELGYEMGTVEIKDMYRAMCYNGIYDIINMNTFNYVNATFDDMFYRFPTQSEYDIAFDMIEFNLSGILFQKAGGNKENYIDILVDTREFYEGLIRWAYLSLVAREATTLEVDGFMTDLWTTHDLQKVQREIMKTDEYANF